MGTRSNIGILEDNGHTLNYCHYDGYPSGVGQTLLSHYADADKVKSLLALGAISVLGEHVDPDPDKPHSFNYDTSNPNCWKSLRQEDVTLAYMRDRGDPADQCGPQLGAVITSVVDENGTFLDKLFLYHPDDVFIEWVYVFDNRTGYPNRWYGGENPGTAGGYLIELGELIRIDADDNDQG